jgi:hypothetical protein
MINVLLDTLDNLVRIFNNTVEIIDSSVKVCTWGVHRRVRVDLSLELISESFW